MRVESINFLGPLEDIDDIFDYNMDVSVKLENGRTYVVVVGTQKNLLTLMDNERSDFLSPGDPMIIVRKLTKEVVEEAIQAYAEDEAYCLKFYAAELDTKTLDVLKDRSIARDKLLDDLLEKGESIDIENYDLIDFNINNDSNLNCKKSKILYNLGLRTKIILSLIFTAKTYLFSTSFCLKISFYSNKKKSADQCPLEEEVKPEVKIDFDQISDEKGDPVLLIPDNNPLLKDKDTFIKVNHEQTKTHLNHAEDLGINLPDNFDMKHYKNLDREGRIEYANQNVPRETIIECQNEIGKAMTKKSNF